MTSLNDFAKPTIVPTHQTEKIQVMTVYLARLFSRIYRVFQPTSCFNEPRTDNASKAVSQRTCPQRLRALSTMTGCVGSRFYEHRSGRILG